MSNVDRLTEYYPFDEDVLEAVEVAAEMQAATDSHEDFFRTVGIKDSFIQRNPDYAPQEMVDIRRGDEKSALLIHLAMGQPLDPNNLYQIGTIAAANPNTRILASANPNGYDSRYGNLTKRQQADVKNGEFASLNEPMVRYIEKNGLESVDQYGYSYGADKALGAAEFEAFEVPKAVVIEPVTLVKRSLIKLAADFGSSNGALKENVERSGKQYIEARKASLGLIGFAGSLVTASNISIARGLARGGFEDRARLALEDQADMELTVAWGTDSELADHEAATEQLARLERTFGSERVRSMVLDGQKHALANNVLLQAAIVTQGLK